MSFPFEAGVMTKVCKNVCIRSNGNILVILLPKVYAKMFLILTPVAVVHVPVGPEKKWQYCCMDDK